MRELEKKFTKKGCTYSQVLNDGNVYIYAVHNDKFNQLPTPSYYEVFLRKTAKEDTLPDGSILQERVIYPKDEHFGSWAWCCSNLESVNFILSEKLHYTPKQKMPFYGGGIDNLEAFMV